MEAMVLTDSNGYLPRSVSAPSRKPSAPSNTALATSVASARVGRGPETMVSTTRVMSTGLPTRLQACTSVFCTRAIFSGSTSRPRLPRDMMMPSDSDRMPWKLSSAWRVSILAKILVLPMPMDCKKRRASLTSSDVRQYDKLRKSISNSEPRAAMHCLSQSLSTGSSFWVLLRPIPCERSAWNTHSRPSSTALFLATQCTSSPFTSITSRYRDDDSAPDTR
mmetsp:Transcript_22192/g.37951  ORF Transcript_22192/g.37951 Transcript_22192/m.37951 type:complete len:221 (-) Transcript_22192:525-1187(-)